MYAATMEPRGVQGLLDFGGLFAKETSRFYFAVADRGHKAEGAVVIFLQLLTNGVELQTDGFSKRVGKKARRMAKGKSARCQRATGTDQEVSSRCRHGCLLVAERAGLKTRRL